MKYFCIHHGNPTEASPEEQDIEMGPAVKFCPFCGAPIENKKNKDIV
jgi:hypothetical protein